MSDNGSCYKAKDFAKACKELGLRHIRTRPYTPKTNGKAESFIQTALREWAYARAYEPQINGNPACPIGRICTIGTALMAVNNPGHLSAAWV